MNPMKEACEVKTSPGDTSPFNIPAIDVLELFQGCNGSSSFSTLRRHLLDASNEKLKNWPQLVWLGINL